MKIKAYLKDKGCGETAFARLVGVSQPTINRLGNGLQMASLELALRIERVSGGKVRAEQVPISLKSRELLRQTRRRPQAA